MYIWAAHKTFRSACFSFFDLTFSNVCLLEAVFRTDWEQKTRKHPSYGPGGKATDCLLRGITRSHEIVRLMTRHIESASILKSQWFESIGKRCQNFPKKHQTQNKILFTLSLSQGDWMCSFALCLCLLLTMLLTLTGLARGGNQGWKKEAWLQSVKCTQTPIDQAQADTAVRSGYRLERQNDVWLTHFTPPVQNVVIAKNWDFLT